MNVCYISYLVITVAAQEGPGIIIAHPGQDVELLCTVTVTGRQAAAWLIYNIMGLYRINAIRNGILAGHTAALGSHNLIVENIMMNDDRNGSDYRCVIVPAQGTLSLDYILEESDPTILYVAGELLGYSFCLHGAINEYVCTYYATNCLINENNFMPDLECRYATYT